MKIIKGFFVFLVFLLLFLGYFHKISSLNQDLGRHLITGKIILETKSIPGTNLFSYTYPNFPFTNHHWLSEVIFYKIFELSGFNGLLILTNIVALIAFAFIFFPVKKANIIALTMASLLYLKVLFERTDVRPEIFSFLFLSIFIAILFKNREKYTRWIFVLPFLELLWVNMHIYFIIGIAVIGLFLTEQLSTFLKRGVTGAGDPHRVPAANEESEDIGWGKSPAGPRALFLIFFLTGIATLVNPNGVNGALYPFRVFQNYGYSVEENQNIFFLWELFQKSTIPYFVSSVLLLFTVLLLNIKKTKPIDWLFSVFFTILAITSVRNFPLFVFVTFIPLVKNFSELIEKIKILSGKSLIRNFTFLFLFLLILWQTGQIFHKNEVGFGVKKGAKEAMDFFEKQNLEGPVFNNFDIGSYLDYRLFPKEKVFVDGRPEAYPKDFFQKIYIPMQINNNIFKKVSQKYNFNLIFFSHTDQTPWASSFIGKIAKDNDWKIIYLDDFVIILLKNNQENSKSIKTFGITEENYKLDRFNDFDSLVRLASFFNKAGWKNKEKEGYQKILAKNPSFCPALYNLSNLLIREKDQAANIYLQKFKYSCQ